MREATVTDTAGQAVKTSLAALEAELTAAWSDPPGDWADWLERWLVRLREVPLEVSVRERIKLLSDAAAQAYMDGKNVHLAVAPISLAVMLAEQLADSALLRRALSIQGLVLGTCGNGSAALACLSRALDVAQQLNDPLGTASAWVNIAVVLSDVALYREAIPCYERAAAVGNAIADPPSRARTAARALSGIAQCYLRMNDFAVGLAVCETALSIAGQPEEFETKLAIALAQTTRSLLLLGLHRITEARAHNATAMGLAKSIGAQRAIVWSETTAALIEAHAGDVEQAIAQLSRAEDRIGRTGPSSLHQDALLALAAAYELAGRHDLALKTNRLLIRILSRARLNLRWTVQGSAIARSSGRLRGLRYAAARLKRINAKAAASHPEAHRL